MSEAKVPYCKRIRDEIRFLSRLEKFVYERTSPYVIDKQVELINRAHEDGVKVGRASRDGLRKALESCQMSPWLSNLDPLQPLTASLRCESCDRTTQIITNALEADGEVGK